MPNFTGSMFKITHFSYYIFKNSGVNIIGLRSKFNGIAEQKFNRLSPGIVKCVGWD
jgi:hypothetical protein